MRSESRSDRDGDFRSPFSEASRLEEPNKRLAIWWQCWSHSGWNLLQGPCRLKVRGYMEYSMRWVSKVILRIDSDNQDPVNSPAKIWWLEGIWRGLEVGEANRMWW